VRDCSRLKSPKNWVCVISFMGDLLNRYPIQNGGIDPLAFV
jgi:hypothetical protein